VPSDQEIVDAFAMLIVGAAELEENDPRLALVTIASICLNQFVLLTKFGYEKGMLQEVPENQEFQPKFVRQEGNE
jgi:hypothetical protein